MLNILTAFGRNDIKSIRRDSLLFYVMLMPWIMLLLLRLIMPGLTTWLADAHDFDLLPYYPLILSFFFLIEFPVMFGVVMGLMVLDERDDDTLTALRVTPVPMASYATYRVGLAVLLSILHILLLLPLTGMLPLARIPPLLPTIVMGGFLSPVFALALLAFARNKVEGMAVMKGFGILMIGSIAAYFVAPPWQLAFGMLPTYWPIKAFWIVSEGEASLPYVLAGAGYYALLLVVLLRRFQQQLR
jgi:fluoroquinolone transport system permease protein